MTTARCHCGCEAGFFVDVLPVEWLCESHGYDRLTDGAEVLDLDGYAVEVVESETALLRRAA